MGMGTISVAIFFFFRMVGILRIVKRDTEQKFPATVLKNDNHLFPHKNQLTMLTQEIDLSLRSGQEKTPYRIITY